MIVDECNKKIHIQNKMVDLVSADRTRQFDSGLLDNYLRLKHSHNQGLSDSDRILDLPLDSSALQSSSLE